MSSDTLGPAVALLSAEADLRGHHDEMGTALSALHCAMADRKS